MEQPTMFPFITNRYIKTRYIYVYLCIYIIYTLQYIRILCRHIFVVLEGITSNLIVVARGKSFGSLFSQENYCSFWYFSPYNLMLYYLKKTKKHNVLYFFLLKAIYIDIPCQLAKHFTISATIFYCFFQTCLLIRFSLEDDKMQIPRHHPESAEPESLGPSRSICIFSKCPGNFYLVIFSG